MTTDIANRGQSTNGDDRRAPSAMFPETSRGVQAASRAFEDGREANPQSDERSRAWRTVVLANLL